MSMHLTALTTYIAPYYDFIFISSLNLKYECNEASNQTSVKVNNVFEQFLLPARVKS